MPMQFLDQTPFFPSSTTALFFGSQFEVLAGGQTGEAYFPPGPVILKGLESQFSNTFTHEHWPIVVTADNTPKQG